MKDLLDFHKNFSEFTLRKVNYDSLKKSYNNIIHNLKVLIKKSLSKFKKIDGFKCKNDPNNLRLIPPTQTHYKRNSNSGL